MKYSKNAVYNVFREQLPDEVADKLANIYINVPIQYKLYWHADIEQGNVLAILNTRISWHSLTEGWQYWRDVRDKVLFELKEKDGYEIF